MKSKVKHLLIVDDDPLVARSIARVLRPEWDTSIARSADEAMARLSTQTYDLVLCDLGLREERDGLQIATEVMSLDATYLGRFLFMSGARPPESRMAELRGRFLSKPFTPTQLAEAIEGMQRAA